VETPDAVQRGRERQAELYGMPLAELFATVCDALELNQTRLAATIGVSAPMLSQLRGGTRVKIGNPAVLDRLRALQQLAERATAGELSAAELEAGVSEVAGGVPAFTATGRTGPFVPDARSSVRVVQDLLRAVASGGEVLAAATAVESASPALAEVLRVYGAGRTEEALAHWQRIGPRL